jgi:hypothetical protein
MPSSTAALAKSDAVICLAIAKPPFCAPGSRQLKAAFGAFLGACGVYQKTPHLNVWRERHFCAIVQMDDIESIIHRELADPSNGGVSQGICIRRSVTASQPQG